MILSGLPTSRVPMSLPVPIAQGGTGQPAADAAFAALAVMSNGIASMGAGELLNLAFAGSTNTNVSTPIFLRGGAAGFALPDNNAYLIIGQVIGRRRDNGDLWVGISRGYAQRVGGVTSGSFALIASTPMSTGTMAAAAGNVFADPASNTLRCACTGLGGVDVDWAGWYFLTRVPPP